MKFLYMDENYADLRLPAHARSVALTGLLVPANQHRKIRARFYGAVADAVGRTPNTVPALPQIHAANLLPDCTDAKRLEFLSEIVKIVVDFELAIFRVGYLSTPELIEHYRTEPGIVSLCFNSLLQVLKPELKRTTVWPVMETDRSNKQDQAFPGQIQFADHIEAHIGTENLTRDSTNLGEVLYSTKRSIHGAIVDCVAYLLKIRQLKAVGVLMTPYKERLHDISEGLKPAVRHDEIIKMRFGSQPMIETSID